MLGDEQVLAIQQHYLAYPKELSRQISNTSLKEIKNKGLYMHHYDAEHNPTVTQVCLGIILFNSKGTKVMTIEHQNKEKSVILTFHADEPGKTEVQSLSTTVEKHVNKYYDLSWINAPTLWGMYNDAQPHGNAHIYLLYFANVKNVKPIKKNHYFLWSGYTDCVKHITDFNNMSKSVIDHYYLRRTFYDTNPKKRRHSDAISA